MFIYIEDKKSLITYTNGKLIEIKNADTKYQLLNIYSKFLNFPQYFGYNWDALYDCLTDVYWMNTTNITIFHEDLPLRNFQNEQKKYFIVLADIINNWKNKKDQPEIRVIFLKKDRNYIEHLLVNIN